MMILFDRYTGKQIKEQDLPDEIDFGRIACFDQEGVLQELTYSNFATSKIIRQEVLLEKNKGLQDIFADILKDVKQSGPNDFNVWPILRHVEDNADLNNFERLLLDKIFHIEEIFRQPHSLLIRNIEKVPVSRAKRIPSKSYQYLAAHTGDWVHKSVVSFKPSRILSEEMDVNFDIYENQLAICFVERCLSYLNSRLKEVQDIRAFLIEFEKLLNDQLLNKGWFRKIDRNLTLIAKEYKDENYYDGSKSKIQASHTEEALTQLQKRLLILRKSELFNVVNKRISQTVTLRNTNALVTHKHYRYIKNLWIEIDQIRPEKSEADKLAFEQNVMNGIQAYAKALVTYSLQDYFGYDLKGNYKKLTATKRPHPEITMNESAEGLLHFSIGEKKFSFVVTGNEPQKENLPSVNATHPLYILYYSENATLSDSRCIHITPMDPDSVERLAAVIRKYMLLHYLAGIHQPYIFKQLLRDYIDRIAAPYVEFNRTTYTYRFISYPNKPINAEDVIGGLESHTLYTKKTRPDKQILINELTGLIEEINTAAITLKTDHLYCFSCHNQLLPNTINELNYLECAVCNCVVDSSQKDIVFTMADRELTKAECGMDSITIKANGL